MKAILITGARGSLGQSVVARLGRNDQNRILATSRDPFVGDDLRLDVRDPNRLALVIRDTKPDLILHLAATFGDDFEAAYAVNVEATRQLLEVVRQSEYRTRVLLIGSASEYGVVRPEENPLREDHVLAPVSIYGLTKAWQTQLAALYASRGVDVVVARIFNLDGQGLSERLFIGRLQKEIDEVLAGRKSVIELGPLSATRDYISTDEAADQILCIAAYGEAGRVYHVASGRPVTMRDVLLRYLAHHKLDASIVRESLSSTNRVGYDVPAIYADITSTTQLMQERSSVEA
ncbi:MAG: NAD-dependent epimerase/dehydratase family protein [Thiobacillus sp.]